MYLYGDFLRALIIDKFDSPKMTMFHGMMLLHKLSCFVRLHCHHIAVEVMHTSEITLCTFPHIHPL